MAGQHQRKGRWLEWRPRPLVPNNDWDKKSGTNPWLKPLDVLI